MRILFLGTHFDDIELGAGGTLIRHVEKGDEVWLAVTNTNEYRTGGPTSRLEEQQRVLELLKIKYSSLQSFESEDSIPEIIHSLDLFKADGIYCPWPDDTHQDHVRTSQIGKAVSRKGANLFYYDSGSALNFNPDSFVEINWSKKQQLLKCFKSQKIPIIKVRDKSWFYGSLIGVESAEGLVVGRMIYNP